MFIHESDFDFFIEFQIPVTNISFVSMDEYNAWWSTYCMGGELNGPDVMLDNPEQWRFDMENKLGFEL